MSNAKVSPADLAECIVKELSEWSEDVTEGVKADVKETAKETVSMIKTNSPVDKRATKRKGRYKRGWNDKITYEDRENIRVTIYNKTDYQLSHLLEFGHEIVRNGKTVGHVNAKPHIRPAEQTAEKKLLNRVIVRVRKG